MFNCYKAVTRESSTAIIIRRDNRYASSSHNSVNVGPVDIYERRNLVFGGKQWETRNIANERSVTRPVPSRRITLIRGNDGAKRIAPDWFQNPTSHRG